MRSLIWIWADESCLGVQFTDRDSPGGAGGLIEHWTARGCTRRDYWLSEPATTNNRMALRSAITGLALLRRPCRVVFTSDSQYLVNGMREWIHAWARRGWKRKGGSIENLDLWKELAPAFQRHEVHPCWVRGHAGNPRNEYANDLAVRAARTQTRSDGLVESGFSAWLEQQREKRERYFDFMEWQEPDLEDFEPVPPVPI